MNHAFCKPEPRFDLEWEAYEDYLDRCGDEASMTFAAWQAERAQEKRDRDEERAAALWEDRHAVR